MNTVPEIATRLASLCSAHQFVQAYEELFSDHAESIDPVYKNEPLKGLAGLIDREKSFLAANTVHEVTFSEPIFSGSYFSLILSMDFTSAAGERKTMQELCVYKTEHGKIISQQFFIG